ncbi:MAG: hypothetical protein P8183_23850, partial [Anaerolineae bacterium]
MSEDKDPTPKFRIKNGRLLIWLVIVLINLAAAQWWLWLAVNHSMPDSPPWLAVAVIGLAVAALVLGLSPRWRAKDQSAGYEVSLRWWMWLRPYRRWLFLVAAILLITIVLYRIPHMAGDASYTAVFLAWLMAIILYCLAVVPRAEWSRPWL